jgi:hypothetical protein
MEWTEFIKYLSIGYLLYYGLIVIMDLLKPARSGALNGEDDILEFSEAFKTTLVEPFAEYQANSSSQNLSEQQFEENGEEWVREEEDTEDLELLEENINVSTGGVTSMQELFRLAQNQSIEVRKQLVF